MQIFIDSADAAELKALAETGLVDGVTTNPSLVAKAGRDFFETLREICARCPGPISAEVVAQDAKTMIKEGLKLRTRRGQHRREGAADARRLDRVQDA
jgi:transaldolase